MKRILTTAVILGSLSWMAVVRAELPLGDQLQVNTYTTGLQIHPSVAIDGDGNVVVVWESIAHPNDPMLVSSILGQRYDSLGAAVGGEFQVNTVTTAFHAYPAVATGAAGELAVVWQSYPFDGSAYNVSGRVYDSGGNPIGGELQVNTYTPGIQRNATLARAGGEFLVVWQSFGSSGTDLSSFSVLGQRIDGSGTLQGGEFQVNTYTTGSQDYPAVAADGSGGQFLVVWESSDASGDPSNQSIQGQRFDSLGMPLANQFQVNAYTTSSQSRPHLTAAAGGDFLVVWDSFGSGGTDGDMNSVQGRLFAGDGMALGGDFQVNTYTTGRQYHAAVTADGDGNFLVVWQSPGSSGDDTDSYSIQGQLYDAGVTAAGGEFQVNAYTTGSQRRAALAATVDGKFTVAWQSLGSAGTDSGSYSVQARRSGDPVDPDNPLELSTSGQFNDEDMDGLGDPGETISYSFTVSNGPPTLRRFGGTPLTNVGVSDTAVATVACPSGNPIPSLAAGATEICTGTYTLTQDDVDAGQKGNLATAVSDQTAAVEAAGTVPLPQRVEVALVKDGALDAGGDGVANPGDLIGYTLTVTNTGNVTLSSMAVTDPLAAISCPSGNPVSELAPGAAEVCTGSYALTQADVDAGSRANTASANGQDPDGGAVADSDSHEVAIVQTPALALTKSGVFVDENGNGDAEVGESIAYEFTVENPGNVTLSGVAVGDPLVPAIGCPSGNPISSLAPGAAEVCTGSYLVTQADLDAGCRLNTATATGDDPNDAPVMDSDRHSVLLNPLFADGFESGDLSGWSSAVGGPPFQ
jgi:uncharacterized repeat protein (TIGR01451 family)